jgi:hypothetical protein
MMWETRMFPMSKKFIVRPKDQERDELVTVIKKLSGTSENP